MSKLREYTKDSDYLTFSNQALSSFPHGPPHHLVLYMRPLMADDETITLEFARRTRLPCTTSVQDAIALLLSLLLKLFLKLKAGMPSQQHRRFQRNSDADP
jgi:hypothetical protein